jgi:predicted dehydrogenase
MRFAILGNHPDGLAMATALGESGRHQLLVYTAPVPAEVLRRWGPGVERVGDLEEVLADPAIDAVLVAGSPVNRPIQLRRALQSERHVLCVHPADAGPDTAYEAAMIQRDTRCTLLPLLPEALHPAVLRLARLCRPGAPDGLGGLRLVELERGGPGAVLVDTAVPTRPALPGWDVLRRLGGEIAEVNAFTEREELRSGAPVFVSGRFEHGGLFRVSVLPDQPAARWRLTVSGENRRAEIVFPDGWPGRAVLTWQDEAGETREEEFEPWDPWHTFVGVFEAATAGATSHAESGPAGGRNPAPPRPSREAIQAERPRAPAAAIAARPGLRVAPGGGRQRPLTWQDEVRCLELDDAARRSAERRRATLLEYPDATEEAGFKGTMTLLGCGLLWLVLALAIASAWVPWLGWGILPLLLLFLVLQVFLRLARPKENPAPPADETPPNALP